MRFNYRIYLLIVSVLLAVFSTIGSSYAVWTITESQNDTNIIASGCFSLSYIDKVDNKSTSIKLINTYPISDEKGLQSSPYIIILKNTCNIAASYELSLTTDKNNTLNDEYLKTSLTNATSNTSFQTNNLNLLKKIDLDKNIILDSNINKKDTYLLANGVLNPNEEVKYELRIWLSEPAPNETMNKKFVAVVNNVAYATEIKKP